MSSSTNYMNNSTVTSNSRSAKKSSKKSSKKIPTQQVEQTESVDSTSILVVETSDKIVTDINSPDAKEVVVQTPPKSVETTPDEQVKSTPDEQVENTPAPSPAASINIWELRKQAKDAEDALKKANDVIEKLSHQITKQVPVVVQNKKVPSDDNDDGFQEVSYK